MLHQLHQLEKGFRFTYNSMRQKPCNARNLKVTLPETNIAPENGWLEYNFPFGMAYFQGLC